MSADTNQQNPNPFPIGDGFGFFVFREHDETNDLHGGGASSRPEKAKMAGLLMRGPSRRVF